MKPKRMEAPPINSGSMADIAFLLLIFFLVTTTILQEKGLSLLLPPHSDEQSTTQIHERNLFKILINSNNDYMINGEVVGDLSSLRKDVTAFILNNGKEAHLSINPEKAIVSMKTSRGTEYSYFIAALDEVKAAYYAIYANNVGLSEEEFLALDHNKATEYDIYLAGKKGYPMNISIAQPD